MSSNNVALNNGQQAIINTDLTKIFIWNNRYQDFRFTNDEYDSVTLSAGTVMGVLSGNGYAKPLESAAADGSQDPMGVLAQDITVDEGDSVNLTLCVAGDVAEEKLIFQGSDTLDTVVDGKSIRSRIQINTRIMLKASRQHTSYDNQ